MKKLTKIISVVLLLSLVLSVFAGFSIFAEEAVGDAAPASSRVEVWNIDSASERTISGAKEGDSFIRTTDEFGNSIWVQKHDLDAKSTVFWNVMLPDASDANSVRFADVVKTTTDAESGAIKPLDEDGDGKADVKYEKNTDYFVIDFDIATDTFFIPDTLLHTRFLSDTLSNSLANVIQSNGTYINVNKGATETSGVTVNSISSKFASGNKWTNVTIVYDVTADFDHMAVEAGGAEAAPTYAGYIYIDGIYVGAASTAWMRDNSKNNKYSTSLQYAKMFESIRVELSTVATGSSTSYANFTISKFPVGYEGMITESGVLGSSVVTLHNIPELQYTLANTPGTPESYTAPKLADITRTVDGVETVIPVYEVDDLHGDLLDGDIVTAYANLKALREISTLR